jgi:hypothetical protein
MSAGAVTPSGTTSGVLNGTEVIGSPVLRPPVDHPSERGVIGSDAPKTFAMPGAAPIGAGQVNPGNDGPDHPGAADPKGT